MISITDEIKDFIKSYKCKPDLFLKDDKPKQVNLLDDKPKPVNLLDSSTDILKDDKPKQINLLDLNKDILNIIGDFVRKDNKEREERERKDIIKREREEIVNSEQIINGKKIIFPTFCGSYLEIPLNTKEILGQIMRMH